MCRQTQAPPRLRLPIAPPDRGSIRPAVRRACISQPAAAPIGEMARRREIPPFTRQRGPAAAVDRSPRSPASFNAGPRPPSTRAAGRRRRLGRPGLCFGAACWVMKAAIRSASRPCAPPGRETSAIVRAGTRLANGRATSEVPLRMPAFSVISGSRVTPRPPSTICTSVARLVASTAGASPGGRAPQATIACSRRQCPSSSSTISRGASRSTATAFSRASGSPARATNQNSSRNSSRTASSPVSYGSAISAASSSADRRRSSRRSVRSSRRKSFRRG